MWNTDLSGHNKNSAQKVRNTQITTNY